MVSDGVGTTHRISVELASTDLAAAGLVAAKARLRGPGENPDEAETMFRPGAAPTRTLALSSLAAVNSHHFEVEGYTAQGLPRTGASARKRQPTLVLPVPTA